VCRWRLGLTNTPIFRERGSVNVLQVVHYLIIVWRKNFIFNNFYLFIVLGRIHSQLNFIGISNTFQTGIGKELDRPILKYIWCKKYE
jgi:hypothetical protein